MTDDGAANIVDFPWEVLEYVSWLRQRAQAAATPGSYLFDQPEVRFEPRDEDVLVLDPGARIEARAGRLRLASPRLPAGMELDGFEPRDREACEAWLGSIDGASSLVELRQRAGSERFELLLRQAFGKLIFSPLALLELERGVSGIEITRFPGSPYEIARNYWQNMAAVRARSTRLEAAVETDERFLHALRELHVVALMGDDLQTYYQPQSPISSGRAAPGRLMHAPSVLAETQEMCLFVRGPRVRAAHLGGVEYHRALCRSLDDLEAMAPRRFTDAAGLDWGRVVHARAAADAAAQDWFCPPRPILPGHVTALRLAFERAVAASHAGDGSRCSEALAHFHRAFIRLHPFHCGNQSLAMNLVGAVLSRLLGAGMPHLMLDHLALRLSPAAYVRVFRRALAAYVSSSTPLAARYLKLASNRARIFELTERLSKAGSDEKVQLTIAAEPEAAHLLLLID